jgi:excinuclease ABC subunit A
MPGRPDAYAGDAGIPRDTAWNQLTPAQRDWVIEGSPNWNGNWNKQWYGVRRFFEYLESKAYKMHIRVLCPSTAATPLHRLRRRAAQAGGAALARGLQADADAVLAPEALSAAGRGLDARAAGGPARPVPARPDAAAAGAPAPLLRPADLPDALRDEAFKLLLEEVQHRLKYLCDVGLGYLTLDRQSRTLSGGEVQRINLTTALGTSLVNTLFVLDEPSIGLHPRDMNRIVQAMQRLRDAGNTLVVVEHDPAVMLAADRLIDMGPGPGERAADRVRRHARAGPRGRHPDRRLPGRAQVGGHGLPALGRARHAAPHPGRRAQHNLKNLSVEFPLQRLTVVTGVSGSGKSTLMQDVLVPALNRHFGQATETPAARPPAGRRPAGRRGVRGPVAHRQDGALQPGQLRRRLGRDPQALRRGAAGAGARLHRRQVQLQRRRRALPDLRRLGLRACGDAVPLRRLPALPRLRRQRYRAEILDVKIERAGRSLSIADVLELTVSEAVQCFAADREVVALQPIVDVGLDYVRLGQPVPTLSGGEAQRLKLAGFLAEAAGRPRQPVAKKGTLFLFDEPTTGLHFDDIAKLMRALRKLLDAGHSLIVIEHNLDVIRAADWLIDLGPEAATPAARWWPWARRRTCAPPHVAHRRGAARVRRRAACGREDRGRQRQLPGPGGARARAEDEAIRIVNAREHNLKALSVDIPRGKFNVITGVSGSGKSTLAFDILFNEGQRRYLESLNAYARSIVQPAGRPEVDAVWGIPPTVAIEQRLSRGGRKSTVGTTTEVWHFLRLLYVKLGVQHCVHDGAPVSRRRPRASPPSCCATTAASTSACWRRWWSTARASTPTWPSGPRRAATRTCASTASSCRWTPGRGWTASRSTPSSCRWATWS